MTSQDSYTHSVTSSKAGTSEHAPERAFRINFGRRLVVAMEDRGWTGVALAEELDVTGMTVSRWRSGSHFITLPKLNRLLEVMAPDAPEALGIWLLGWSDEYPTGPEVAA